MRLRVPQLAIALLVCAAVGLPCPVTGQASTDLQPLDDVHDDLDRLRAWGLIDTVVVGQRPYSRAQAARLTAQAMRQRERLPSGSPLAPTADAALARLSERLRSELAAQGALPATERRSLHAEARVDATWTDSPARGVPSNLLGATAARIHPLLAYDLGREVGTGVTVGTELEIGAALGGWIATAVRSRAQHLLPPEGASESTVTLQTGQARVLLGNAAITVGRDHVVWGQPPRGGLVLSTNPGALLLVSLATEQPVVLPRPLRLLGPSSYQLFLADLGTEAQRFAHSQLFGARASFLPHRRVEVGLQFLVQSGGEGAPESTLGDRILDYLFFPDLFIADRDLQASNKVAGLDARVRVPEAHGLEIWMEVAIDDIDIDRFRSMLWEDGSWAVGARMARLDAAGKLGIQLEAQHTGLRMYEHGDFTSGLTLSRHLLGSELGPNANAATLRIGWEMDPGNAFSVTGAVERRSNDPYTLVEGTPYYFARLGIRPKEVRWRATAGWERRPLPGERWRLQVQVGYERVENFEFAQVAGAHTLLARTVLVARLP